MLKLLEPNRDCESWVLDAWGDVHVVAVEPCGDQIVVAVDRSDDRRRKPVCGRTSRSGQ